MKSRVMAFCAVLLTGLTATAAERDDAKPLQEEVRELKWLAQTLAERLKTLEDRLHLEEGAPGSHRGGLSSIRKVMPDDGDSSATGHIPVEISGPPKLTIFDKSPTEDANARRDRLPLTVLLRPGDLFAIKPAGEGKPLYACVQLAYSVSDQARLLQGRAVPLSLDQADLDAALSGKTVTKAVYLAGFAGTRSFESLSSTESIGLSYVLQEAFHLGTTMLVVQLSKEPPSFPPPIDATKSGIFDQSPRPIVAGEPATDAPSTAKQDIAQIIFSGPEGMVVRWDVSEPGKFDSKPVTVPARYIFPCGAIYRLKLTDIPGQTDVEFHPALELAPLLSRTEEYLQSNVIPICFEEADFDDVLSGGFFTNVVYLPYAEPGTESPPGVETLSSRLLEPGLDPIVEADRGGTILAIVRLGRRDIIRISRGSEP